MNEADLIKNFCLELKIIRVERENEIRTVMEIRLVKLTGDLGDLRESIDL